jgi:hypothetical protein
MSIQSIAAYPREEVELVRSIVSPTAPDEIIRLVMHRCETLGVDPLGKMIYPINRPMKNSRLPSFSCPNCNAPLRKSNDGNGWYCWAKQGGCGKTYPNSHPLFAGAGEEAARVDNWVLQSSIDLFRSIAESSEGYAGQEGPYWCGEDAVWRDVWVPSGAPVAAKVGILRSTFREPLFAVAHFREYYGSDEEKSGGMSGKMPAGQIAKCAESLAIRRAFPSKLSGIYTADEMEQADRVETRSAPPTQAPAAAKTSVTVSEPLPPTPVAQTPPNALPASLPASLRAAAKALGIMPKQIDADLRRHQGDIGALEAEYVERATTKTPRGTAPPTSTRSERADAATAASKASIRPPENADDTAPAGGGKPVDELKMARLEAEAPAESSAPTAQDFERMWARFKVSGITKAEDRMNFIEYATGTRFQSRDEMTLDDIETVIEYLRHKDKVEKEATAAFSSDEEPEATDDAERRPTLIRAQAEFRSADSVALLQERFPAKSARDARLEYASKTVGFPVESFSVLSDAQISMILMRLNFETSKRKKPA